MPLSLWYDCIYVVYRSKNILRDSRLVSYPVLSLDCGLGTGLMSLVPSAVLSLDCGLGTGLMSLVPSP